MKIFRIQVEHNFTGYEVTTVEVMAESEADAGHLALRLAMERRDDYAWSRTVRGNSEYSVLVTAMPPDVEPGDESKCQRLTIGTLRGLS